MKFYGRNQEIERSLQHVNNEVLSLYYGIGQYISENTRRHFWGTGAMKTISDQLQKEMPGLTGFGETSLKNMRTFYEEWSEYVNRQPAVDELPIDETELLVQIRQPMGVATFRLGENAPEAYNNILPNTKGLNELMQDTDQN